MSKIDYGKEIDLIFSELENNEISFLKAKQKTCKLFLDFVDSLSFNFNKIMEVLDGE